jgi:hypothetical protein
MRSVRFDFEIFVHRTLLNCHKDGPRDAAPMKMRSLAYTGRTVDRQLTTATNQSLHPRAGDGAVVIDTCSSHLAARAIATPYFPLASIVLLQEREQLRLTSKVRRHDRRVVSSDMVVRD